MDAEKMALSRTKQMKWRSRGDGTTVRRRTAAFEGRVPIRYIPGFWAWIRKPEKAASGCKLSSLASEHP